ncbi:MAG: glycosyltransferase, partial [Colwellia sp.]
MKVLQLSLSCAPNWKDGGPPRIMYDYAVQLALLGHEITVLTPDANKVNSKQCWPGFPSRVNVNYFKKYNDWRRFFYFDFSFQELYAFFKNNQKNIDIIHLSQSRSLVNIVALKASKDFGIPI